MLAGSESPRFWVIAAFVYMALIYSTAIHYAFGPERSINLSFFTWPKENNPVLQEHFPDKGRWEGENLNDIDAPLVPVNFWKLSSVWGDAGYYVLQARSLDASIPPFKYRFLPTSIVGTISSMTRVPVPIVFAIVNSVLTLCTALVFTAFLLRDFRFSPVVSLVGGMLFITMIANTGTIPLPMLEPACLLFATLIFIALHRRDCLLFVISSTLGVATKEVLVATSVLWLLNDTHLRAYGPRQWGRSLMISAAPVACFVAIRLAMGGGALDVNYGYDLFKGEIPVKYAARLLHPLGAADIAVRVFLSFSFLWAGLLNLRRHPFLLRNAVFIPLIIVATVVLSSRICRVLGILFPIVIPSFLIFFQGGTSPSARVDEGT